MKNRQWLHIMQMILTAPGRELYLEAGRLKSRPERVRAILLILLLPILAVLLWSIRKNFYVLVFGGGVMAVGFFYIYFTLYEKREKILGFLAKLFEPFYRVFEKHRKAAGWGQPKGGGKKVTSAKDNTAGPAGRASDDARDTGHEDEYFRRWKEAAGRAREAKKHEWENRRRSGSRRTEDKRNEERQRSSSGSGSSRSEERKAYVGADAARQEAETIFMVKYPYDEAEIKSKRNMLLKKYHPDNPEGSEEMCKKINECYAVLMKYI